MRIRRTPGSLGGQSGSGRNRVTQWSNPSTDASPTDLGRHEQYDGIRRRPEPTAPTALEARVLAVLDDELVGAREIAAFAGVSVYECRRALATLRTLGLADAERRGNVNGWRRAL